MVKIITGTIRGAVQHNAIIYYIDRYFKASLHSKYILKRNMYIGNMWSSLLNDTYWCWKPLGFNRCVVYG